MVTRAFKLLSGMMMLLRKVKEATVPPEILHSGLNDIIKMLSFTLYYVFLLCMLFKLSMILHYFIFMLIILFFSCICIAPVGITLCTNTPQQMPFWPSVIFLLAFTVIGKLEFFGALNERFNIISQHTITVKVRVIFNLGFFFFFLYILTLPISVFTRTSVRWRRSHQRSLAGTWMSYRTLTG